MFDETKCAAAIVVFFDVLVWHTRLAFVLLSLSFVVVTFPFLQDIENMIFFSYRSPLKLICTLPWLNLPVHLAHALSSHCQISRFHLDFTISHHISTLSQIIFSSFQYHRWLLKNQTNKSKQERQQRKKKCMFAFTFTVRITFSCLLSRKQTWTNGSNRKIPVSCAVRYWRISICSRFWRLFTFPIRHTNQVTFEIDSNCV